MFEWDPRKAEGNRGKHSVSFEEAATVFSIRNFSIRVFADCSKSSEARRAKIGRPEAYLLVRCSEAIERNEAYESFSVVCLRLGEEMMKKRRGSSAPDKRAGKNETGMKSNKINFSDIPNFPTTSFRPCVGSAGRRWATSRENWSQFV